MGDLLWAVLALAGFVVVVFGAALLAWRFGRGR